MFEAADARFESYYNLSSPLFDKEDLEPWFRVLRVVFIHSLRRIEGWDLFSTRYGATNRRGHSPRMRATAALRVLSYRKACNEMGEVLEMFRSSVCRIFNLFSDEFVTLFGEKYLRAPTSFDQRCILAISAVHGFPGCIGSWECQHWKWKNCPVARLGHFKGREKKPTIELEGIPDAEV